MALISTITGLNGTFFSPILPPRQFMNSLRILPESPDLAALSFAAPPSGVILSKSPILHFGPKTPYAQKPYIGNSWWLSRRCCIVIPNFTLVCRPVSGPPPTGSAFSRTPFCHDPLLGGRCIRLTIPVFYGEMISIYRYRTMLATVLPQLCTMSSTQLTSFRMICLYIYLPIYQRSCQTRILHIHFDMKRHREVKGCDKGSIPCHDKCQVRQEHSPVYMSQYVQRSYRSGACTNADT